MLWRYERMAVAMGYQVVAGVDEVGMGPLAGPVVGGAAVLPVGVKISGLDDSKALTFAERERLDAIIRRKAVAVAVCAVDHAQIDRIDVLRHGDVRQGRLYYLRGKIGKGARIRERRGAVIQDAADEEAEAQAPEAAEEEAES